LKYSIFHTSHCGSTLLATLLKDSLDTYCEPHWTAYQDCRYFMMAKNHTLVKYPSYSSMACRILPGKKIFIYRRLKDHLQKITSSKKLIEKNIDEYFPFCKNKRNLFPDLTFDNDLKKIAFVWIHRYLDAYYSQDVLKINANDLFLNPKKTVNKVTNFFGVERVKNFDHLNFYVKKDFNSKNEKLSDIKPKEKIPFKLESGYINSDNFQDIEYWIEAEILNKIRSNQIFPLLRDKDKKPIYYFLPGVTIKS